MFSDGFSDEQSVSTILELKDKYAVKCLGLHSKTLEEYWPKYLSEVSMEVGSSTDVANSL